MHQIFEFISVIFGLDHDHVCSQPGLAAPLTLAIGTLYTAIFTIAMFFGDLSVHHFVTMESAVGLVSTILTYMLGFSIIRSSREKRRSKFLVFLSTVLMSAQTALVFNLFPIEVTNILYYLASTLTLVFISGLAKAEEIIKHTEEHKTC